MNVLSLFDGISCGMVALHEMGINVEKYYSCEIEKNALAISKKNFPEIIQLGNVFDNNFYNLGNVDLLIGGSPCTFWSIAKKGRETDCTGFGFELFMQYVRALNETNPRYFLYENNYSMTKEIREEITKQLKCEPILIDSALFSAQSRKRLYWTNIPIRELPKKCNIYLTDIIESGFVDRKKSLCITRRYAGFNGSQSYLCRRYFGKSFGQAVFEGNIEDIKNKWLNNPYFESDGNIIRRLTVKECERLQCLPDNYTLCDGVTENMRYECIGNGWTVSVIKFILGGIENA